MINLLHRLPKLLGFREIHLLVYPLKLIVDLMIFKESFELLVVAVPDLPNFLVETVSLRRDYPFQFLTED